MARQKAYGGYIARKVMRYDLSELDADPIAIKLAITPPTSETTYSGGDLDGAFDVSRLYMRVPTVTTSASASTFNIEDPILFVGRNAADGNRTVKVFLTASGGGETVSALPENNDGIGIDQLDSIVVPAQLQALGTMSFGYGDGVVFDGDDMAVSVSTDGGAPREVVISGPNGITESLPLPLEIPCGQRFTQLYNGASGTTADPILVQV